MMDKDFEKVIFGKKTFSDLLKDIYSNNQKTEKQITELITALKPFIKTPTDAMHFVPLIKQYLDVKVMNDEHLVKMAAIVQRAIATSANKNNGEGDFILSDDEKKQLLLEINAVGEQQVLIEQKAEKLLENNDVKG